MVDIQDAALFGQLLGHRKGYRGIRVISTEKGKEYNGDGGVAVFHWAKLSAVWEKF